MKQHVRGRCGVTTESEAPRIPHCITSHFPPAAVSKPPSSWGQHTQLHGIPCHQAPVAPQAAGSLILGSFRWISDRCAVAVLLTCSAGPSPVPSVSPGQEGASRGGHRRPMAPAAPATTALRSPGSAGLWGAYF